MPWHHSCSQGGTKNDIIVSTVSFLAFNSLGYISPAHSLSRISAAVILWCLTLASFFCFCLPLYVPCHAGDISYSSSTLFPLLECVCTKLLESPSERPLFAVRLIFFSPFLVISTLLFTKSCLSKIGLIQTLLSFSITTLNWDHCHR